VFRKLLKKISRELRRQNVPYIVTGGQAINRAKEIKFGKTEVRFAALEDIIIHKVIAERARDIEDVKSIILKNPDYDARYIEKWLAEFDNFLDENFREKFKILVDQIKRNS